MSVQNSKKSIHYSNTDLIAHTVTVTPLRESVMEQCSPSNMRREVQTRHTRTVSECHPISNPETTLSYQGRQGNPAKTTTIPPCIVTGTTREASKLSTGRHGPDTPQPYTRDRLRCIREGYHSWDKWQPPQGEIRTSSIVVATNMMPKVLCSPHQT